MATAVQLNLPWRMLRENLVKLDPKTQMALYKSTFDDYALENSKYSSVSCIMNSVGTTFGGSPHPLRCCWEWGRGFHSVIDNGSGQ